MDTVSTSATPDVQAVEGFERTSVTSVTPDVQVVSARKMRWDKAIRNLIHIRGEEGVKKVFPFVDEPDSNQEKAYWTKVRDTKPWAQRGGIGIRRSWEKLADELCMSLVASGDPFCALG